MFRLKGSDKRGLGLKGFILARMRFRLAMVWIKGVQISEGRLARVWIKGVQISEGLD